MPRFGFCLLAKLQDHRATPGQYQPCSTHASDNERQQAEEDAFASRRSPLASGAISDHQARNSSRRLAHLSGHAAWRNKQRSDVRETATDAITTTRGSRSAPAAQHATPLAAAPRREARTGPGPPSIARPDGGRSRGDPPPPSGVRRTAGERSPGPWSTDETGSQGSSDPADGIRGGRTPRVLTRLPTGSALTVCAGGGQVLVDSGHSSSFGLSGMKRAGQIAANPSGPFGTSPPRAIP